MLSAIDFCVLKGDRVNIKETGFLAVSVRCDEYSREKPGFWPPV